MRRQQHYWRQWLFAFVFLAACLGWFSFQWRPGLTAYPVQGVDVSDTDGKIAWPTVEAAGADFAYLKATEGADITDPRFVENWSGVAAAGMRRGAYHVFSLCRPAADQATSFISVVPRDADALPAAIRLTLSGNCAARPNREAMLDDLQLFIEMVEAHTGKTVLIGLSSDFEDEYRVSAAVDRPLWLTGFFIPPSYAGRDWAMWQASTFRRVKGIGGGSHWNVIHE